MNWNWSVCETNVSSKRKPYKNKAVKKHSTPTTYVIYLQNPENNKSKNKIWTVWSLLELKITDPSTRTWRRHERYQSWLTGWLGHKAIQSSKYTKTCQRNEWFCFELLMSGLAPVDLSFSLAFTFFFFFSSWEEFWDL